MRKRNSISLQAAAIPSLFPVGSLVWIPASAIQSQPLGSNILQSAKKALIVNNTGNSTCNVGDPVYVPGVVVEGLIG